MLGDSTYVPERKRNTMLYRTYQLMFFITFEQPPENLHQRMWKSDFRTVDGAIACGFDNSEEICIFRIEDDVCERFLQFKRQ